MFEKNNPNKEYKFDIFFKNSVDFKAVESRHISELYYLKFYKQFFKK